MPHEAKGFQCNFCKRMFGRRVDAANHENACKFNPARRSCYTCKHGEMMEFTEHIEFLGSSEELPYKSYGCKHFGKPMVEKPYYIDCDTDDDGIHPVRPRPGTCAFWEWKGDEDDDV